MFLSLISRPAILVVGYLYPAYDCYKSLEHGRPSMEQLRFWCQYWMILGVLTVLESFISWLPFYCEMKIMFLVYLLHPKSQGANWIYTNFLVPFIAKYEPEVDRQMIEFGLRARGAAQHCGQSAAKSVRIWVMEGLHYLAAHSPRHLSHALQRPILEEAQIPNRNVYQVPRVIGEDDPAWAEELRGTARRRVVIQEEDDFDEYDLVEPVISEPRRSRNPSESPTRAAAYTKRGEETGASTVEYVRKLRPRTTRRNRNESG